MENYHVVKSTKSVGVGILLSLLLGPIGLFYSSVWGGIIMTFSPIVLLVIFFFGLSFESESLQIVSGVAFIVCWAFWWLICMIWSVIAIGQYNRRIMNRSNYSTSTYQVSLNRESSPYLSNHTNQLAYRETNLLPKEIPNNDTPGIQEWLKANPNKGINDYYVKFRK